MYFINSKKHHLCSVEKISTWLEVIHFIVFNGIFTVKTFFQWHILLLWMLPVFFPCFLRYSIKKRPFANEQQQSQRTKKIKYNNTFQLFGVIMLCFMCCCCFFHVFCINHVPLFCAAFVCLYNIFFFSFYLNNLSFVVCFFLCFSVHIVSTVVRKV